VNAEVTITNPFYIYREEPFGAIRRVARNALRLFRYGSNTLTSLLPDFFFLVLHFGIAKDYFQYNLQVVIIGYHKT